MYKLLIVEDEKSIAQGIAQSNPWEEWGFRVAGICYNGMEAVEFINRDKPDIVLSDIRMPQMDGMALMQYLNQNYPEIKIIILSGYNDFEYLQMSIRNRVAEYLLKPTDVDEFVELFLRMKRTLDEEARTRKEQQYMRMERGLNALLRGYGYNEEKVDEKLFVEDMDRFGIVLFRIENGCWEDKREFFEQKQAVVRALNQCEEENAGEPIAECADDGDGAKSGPLSRLRRGRCFCNFEEEITGLYCIGAELEEAELKEYVLLLNQRVLEDTGLTLSCGISCFYDDYRMLPQCYEQTKCCISQSLFQEKSSGIHFFQQITESGFDYYKVTFDEEKMVKYILSQDKPELEQEIAGIFQNLSNQTSMDYDYVNRMGQEILFIISRRMLKYNVHPEQIMNEEGFTYAEFMNQTTLKAKQDYLMGIFSLFMKKCAAEQNKNSKTRDLARAIRDIVDEEYCSNFISLEYVAEKVQKNQAYISKIFKIEFECNFSTYITERRLEKSRKLLENPVIKIYEISQQLGWADVSNYIKVFKKKYGISPDEYRRISVK